MSTHQAFYFAVEVRMVEMPCPPVSDDLNDTASELDRVAL